MPAGAGGRAPDKGAEPPSRDARGDRQGCRASLSGVRGAAPAAGGTPHAIDAVLRGGGLFDLRRGSALAVDVGGQAEGVASEQQAEQL